MVFGPRNLLSLTSRWKWKFANKNNFLFSSVMAVRHPHIISTLQKSSMGWQFVIVNFCFNLKTEQIRLELRQFTFVERQCFAKMIASVEKNGYGKELLRGHYHKIYPPSGWRLPPKVRHPRDSNEAFLSYHKAPKGPDKDLRIVCEETSPGVLRIIGVFNSHGLYEQFLDTLPRTDYEPAAVFNFDEDPDSEHWRKHFETGKAMKGCVQGQMVAGIQ